MQLAKVVGTVVSTRKEESLAGLKLLSVSNTHPVATYQLFFDKGSDKLIMRGWDGAQPRNASDQSGTSYRLSTIWG